MSDEKKYTEREVVVRERVAYVAGLRDACWRDPATEKQAMARAYLDASIAYPLPKVTRPRVVKAGISGSFRYVDGHYEYRGFVGTWERADPHQYVVPIAYAEQIAALKMNSTEEVEG